MYCEALLACWCLSCWQLCSAFAASQWGPNQAMQCLSYVACAATGLHAGLVCAMSDHWSDFGEADQLSAVPHAHPHWLACLDWSSDLPPESQRLQVVTDAVALIL